MNNSQQLLYILPDLAYIVELLPTSKPHSFSIHNFRQINGQFVDDNEFIEANLEKLMSKLGDTEYKLVLPDFLFTNTILNIKETSEENVRQYLKEKLLPSLDLSEETHDIKIIILTEHKGVFKVQLSALEKTLLEPLRSSLKGKKVKISSVVPLSWTVKSIVSLEPSISIIQLGDSLYLSQHYIGIDQTTFTPVSEADNLIETVKTLKGAEPSLQTIYLLSSGLVEENLKGGLTKTLPLQQLASFKETEVEMPSYVKQIIEASAKTLSIVDYMVPEFSIGESTGKSTAKDNQDDSVSENISIPTPVVLGDEPADTDVKLPAPMVATASNLNAEEAVVMSKVIDISEEKIEEEKPTLEEKTMDTTVIEPVTPVDEIKEVSNIVVPKPKEISMDKDNTVIMPKEPEVVKEEIPVEIKVTPEVTPTITPIVTKPVVTNPVVTKPIVTSTPAKKKIIKDKSGVSPMLKMFFVGLVSFFATIGIGVGLGLGYLSLSGEGPETVMPIAEVSPTPVIEEVTPTPTPLPEINKEEIDILVVNATTKSGYAGTVASELEDSGFVSVDAGNAKGDYEEGNYILIDGVDESLSTAIEDGSELDFEVQDDKTIEDPKDAYDVVVVLAE